MTNKILIKINGVAVSDFYPNDFKSIGEVSLVNVVQDLYSKTDIKKLKKLSVWLWGISATMLLSNTVNAQETEVGSETLWDSMLPIFRIFQELAMVLGAIALFSGLIIMMFKKAEGRRFLTTSAFIIAGCFVVPAAIMLIAIVGTVINDALVEVFRNSNLRNSVDVGG